MALTLIVDTTPQSTGTPATIPEVAAKNRGRIGAEPAIDDARINRAEIGFVPHVGGVVLQRRIAGIGRERWRGAVDAAPHAAANGHHHAGSAVIGAATSVLRQSAGRTRRTAESACRSADHGCRDPDRTRARPSFNVVIRVGVCAALRRVRVVSARLHPEDPRADLRRRARRRQRAGPARIRCSDTSPPARMRRP